MLALTATAFKMGGGKPADFVSGTCKATEESWPGWLMSCALPTLSASTVNDLASTAHRLSSRKGSCSTNPVQRSLPIWRRRLGGASMIATRRPDVS
jgi:hypothetical protein